MNSLRVSLSDLGRPFWTLWMGEVISALGRLMMQFAMGVWVYQRTGSALDFAGVIVAGLVPHLLVLPIAGGVIDRLDRRRVIICSDAVAASTSVAIILLLWRDQLQVVHLYASTLVFALTHAFRSPAYRALVGAILRDDQLTRASGLIGVNATALGIVTPALAGALIAAIGLTGLAILELLTFSIGAMLIWQAFTSDPRSEPASPAGMLDVLRDSMGNFRSSLAFFRQSASMSGLLCYALIQSALLTLVATLATPLILANHSPQALGLALSFAAAGSLVGSMLMALLDSPRWRGRVILACDAVFACCVVGFGVVESLPAYYLLQGIGCCAGSVAASCTFALWISKVPEAQRGSVLVVASTAAAACTAVVVLFGATLASAWLEPALAQGQILANIGELLLTVPNGRGIAMVFVLCGTLGLIAALGGFVFKPLRNLQ